MKYLNWKVNTVAIALLTLSLTACSGKEAQSPQALTDKEQEKSASMTRSQTSSQEAAPGTQAVTSDDNAIVIIGKVESNEGELYITTAEGNFMVEGKDLSEMIGSTVQVTGALKESAGIRTIEVTDVVDLE